MIIYTAKFSKKKALGILAALAIVISAIILASPEKEAGQPTFASGQRVIDGKDVCSFIASLGYTPDEAAGVSKDVTIPSQFDQVYESYNEIQKECGFDLTGYKGKKATLYTYPLTDYPGQEEVLCDVLVCRQRIIGGNIYTAAIDGFMHGLRPADS